MLWIILACGIGLGVLVTLAVMWFRDRKKFTNYNDMLALIAEANRVQTKITICDARGSKFTGFVEEYHLDDDSLSFLSNPNPKEEYGDRFKLRWHKPYEGKLVGFGQSFVDSFQLIDIRWVQPTN